MPGCNVNNLPPSHVEVRNEWNYTCSPPVCLHGMNKENLPLPL
jgi:hypothetical protein